MKSLGRAGSARACRQWTPGDAVAADVDQLRGRRRRRCSRRRAAGKPAQSGSAGPCGACLDGAWEVTRAVANAAFIDAGRPGRIVYLAPPSRDAARRRARGAARAGLENLARTLSIEWARYAITLVTIAPGEHVAGEVGALAAYLGSPAGAYFSGCLLDLTTASARRG